MAKVTRRGEGREVGRCRKKKFCSDESKTQRVLDETIGRGMDLNDDELVVKAVFAKFSSPRPALAAPSLRSSERMMGRHQFILMITRLATHIPELKGVEMEQAEAAFALANVSGDGLTFDDFLTWWSSDNRFIALVGQKAKQLREIWVMYKRHSSEVAGGTSTTPRIALRESGFNRVLEELDIDADFYYVADNDLTVDFGDFCRKLNWLL